MSDVETVEIKTDRLCDCPPKRTRPKRGSVCGACRRFVLGPPRDSDTAFELEQTVHAGRGMRGRDGVAGATRAEERGAFWGAGLFLRSERVVRARDRHQRRERAWEAAHRDLLARVAFGYDALRKLGRILRPKKGSWYHPAEAKKRERARAA